MSDLYGTEFKSISKESLINKPELKKRIDRLTPQFKELFKREIPPSFINSPGRCEWLGNHTDYNGGVAVGVAIDRSVLSAFAKNENDSDQVRVYSNEIGGVLETFTLEELKDIKSVKEEGRETKWTDYIKGVLREFVLRFPHETFTGLDILIDSTVPLSGGTSSSAALELAIAGAFAKANNITLSKQDMALLSQNAEVKFVGSGCGYLDQGSVAFGEEGKGTQFKFHPGSVSNPADIESVDIDVEKYGYTYMLAVDPHVKRKLGESGYPIRKKQCKKGLKELKQLLPDLMIQNLGDVPLKRFLEVKDRISTRTIADRVHHVIAESERVHQGLEAIKKSDIKALGEIINESGKSGLFNFELNQKTPELTKLCNIIWSNDLHNMGVYGRNMGGGFAANVLMLVPIDKVEDIKKLVKERYIEMYPTGKDMEFIAFKPSDGVTYIET